MLLPHAGGTSWSYGALVRRLRDRARCSVVEYPGHGTRRREPLARELPELVADARAQVRAVLEPGVPVVVAGHSMGSLVALELVRALERDDVPVRHLVVSGREPADVASFWRPLHPRPHDEVADELTRLGGVPQVLRDDRDAMRHFLPAILADLRIAETWTSAREPRLGCPITTVHGRDDELVRADLMPGWDGFTTAGCEVVELDGGHMVVERDRYARLLDAVLQDLAVVH